MILIYSIQNFNIVAEFMVGTVCIAASVDDAYFLFYQIWETYFILSWNLHSPLLVKGQMLFFICQINKLFEK